MHPKLQGVTGFLKAAGGKFSTRNVQITSTNDYASLLVVSLDKLPLSTSKRVLVQVGTTARPHRLGGKVRHAQNRRSDGQRSRSRFHWHRTMARREREHQALDN
jgi:hypothetical protein